jgi:hypothetical protein
VIKLNLFAILFFCFPSVAENVKKYSTDGYEFQLPEKYSVQKQDQRDEQRKCINLVDSLFPKRIIMRLCIYEKKIQSVYEIEQYSRYDILPLDAKKMVGNKPKTGIAIFSGDWFWPTDFLQSRYIKGIHAKVDCGEESEITGNWMPTGSKCYMAIFEKNNESLGKTISISSVLKSANFGENILLRDAKKIVNSVRFK